MPLDLKKYVSGSWQATTVKPSSLGTGLNSTAAIAAGQVLYGDGSWKTSHIPPGIRFKYSNNTTMSDPGSGYWRANNSVVNVTYLNLVTKLVIDNVDFDGNSIKDWLENTANVNGYLFIYGTTDGVNWSTDELVIFKVTAVTAKTGYTELEVDYMSGYQTAIDNLDVCYLQISPVGPRGPSGADGTDGTNGTNGTDGDDGREVQLQKGTTHIQWKYDTDSTWTNIISLSDLEGADGLSFNWRGTFDNQATNYVVNDAVSHNGTSYVCIANVSQAGLSPSGNPSYWDIVAQKGADGTDGTNGTNGFTPTITVGTVTTGDAGTSVSVSNSGTPTEVVLDFTIPKGDKGTDGTNGTNGTDGEGFAWRGAYSSSVIYGKNDVVSSGGNLYIYINSTVASGQDPHSATTYWNLYLPGVEGIDSTNGSTSEFLNEKGNFTTLPKAGQTVFGTAQIYLDGTILCINTQ